MTVDEIIEGLKGLTLAEAEELVEKLIAEFPKLAEMPAAGVAVAAPASVAAAVAEAPVEEAEEPTEFTLVLVDAGAERVKVIKAVRQITNNALGLKEAKEAVDSVPFTVLEAVDKEQAENGKKLLEEAGATAEVRPA